MNLRASKMRRQTVTECCGALIPPRAEPRDLIDRRVVHGHGAGHAKEAFVARVLQRVRIWAHAALRAAVMLPESQRHRAGIGRAGPALQALD